MGLLYWRWLSNIQHPNFPKNHPKNQQQVPEIKTERQNH